MTRFAKAAVLSMAMAAIAGCGGGEAKKPEPAPAKGGGDKAAAAPAPAPAGGGGKYDKAKSTASVSGTVKFGGTKPAPVKIEPSSDAFCQSQWSGKEMLNERFVVADGGGMPNAFVWATKGPMEGMTGFDEPAPFVLDQVGCRYVPHVFGVRANQTFVVKNSDQTTHNVHVHSQSNGEPNSAQAAGQKNDFVFKQKEKAIQFQCDVHSWMSAIAFVLDHPFFAVTDANGKFDIKGLPAGTYTFKVWHESFTAGQKELAGSFDLTVKDGEAATKDVELK